MANTVSVKAPEPEKFYGDSVKLEVWLYQVQLYFDAIGWDPNGTHATRCASFAASLLRGPALQWHHRQSLTNQGAPTTYNDLSTALRT